MRKFLTEHPILGTCLFSCTLVLLLGVGFSTLVALVIGKAIMSLPESSSITVKESKYTYVAGNEESENKLLSIPIKGVILTNEEFSDPFSLFLPSVTYGYSVKNELVNAAEDLSIKGIILEIDSPGGTITGANAISDGIEYYRNKTQNPVYVHISGLGASGGYLVAATADKIFADTGSLTGSIGVIMGPFKYYDKVIAESDFSSSVQTENGIESFNITAGKDKDLGDPYKRLSENARSVLQQGVNNEYEIFVQHVSKYRNIPGSTIKDKLGALVFDNKQAKEFGLIDDTRNKDQAYLELANAANIIDDDFQVVGAEGSDFWSSIFKSAIPFRPSLKSGHCAVCGQMLYLYGNPEEYILVK